MQPENFQKSRTIDTTWRSLDPIDSIEVALDDERTADLALNIEEINQILTNDDTLLPSERRSLSRLSLGMQLDEVYHLQNDEELPFSVVWEKIKSTKQYFSDHMEEFQSVSENDLPEKWRYELQGLDAQALVVHALASQAETTYRGTSRGKELSAYAEHQAKTLLFRSSKLIHEISSHGIDSKGSKGSDTRGILYETLLISYSRLKQYEQQTFGSSFARMALEREDRPITGYAYPKRAFDIVMRQGSGATQMIQAKNHHENTEYAQPIKKISPDNFRQIVKQINVLSRDFMICIDNSSKSDMKDRIDESYDRLDAAFGEQLSQFTKTPV